MARPTKHHLLPEVCKHIANGVPIKHACAAAGIASSTLRGWLADEERQGEDSPYAGTHEAIESAKAASVIGLLDQIYAAASDDWRAAAWMLERRFPNDFGKVTRLAGPDGGPVQVEVQSEARAAERILARLKTQAAGLAATAGGE